jgi:predicted Zn-dependent protease
MEADYLGIQYLYKTGYDPGAAITVLRKFQASSPQFNPQTSSILQSPEPQLADRIALLEKSLVAILPTRNQNVVTTSEFDSIKAQLKR